MERFCGGARERRSRGEAEGQEERERGVGDRDPHGEEAIDAGEDDGEQEERSEAGKRNVNKLQDPTEEEVKKYYVSGHIPYRSWCHHCA